MSILTDYSFFYFKYMSMYVHTLLDFMHLIVLTEIPLKLLFWNNLTSKQRNTIGLLKSYMCFYFTHITKDPNIFWSLEIPNGTDNPSKDSIRPTSNFAFDLQQKQLKLCENRSTNTLPESVI